MSIEAMKLALEALEVSRNTLNASRNWLQHKHDVTHDIAITALRQAIEQAQKQEPVAWRDHVEQRLLTWRQSFVNKSGDQLALDDFMDKRSLDDLIEFVCDEYTSSPQRQPLDENEQYRMQMAGICTAAIGYWKEGDDIHPDYDTPALRDVARLYARFDALYKSQRQPLTDEQIDKAITDEFGGVLVSILDVARAIEAAHGIKGEA